MSRDRDAQGRARNARPRDGLGRPLAYGSPGEQREPEGVARTPAESLARAQQLLDEDHPFHAHEVLEDAWKAAPDAERALWKALAQLAVAQTHERRGNAGGAESLRERAADALAGYTGEAHGVDVARLLSWTPDSALRLVRPPEC